MIYIRCCLIIKNLYVHVSMKTLFRFQHTGCIFVEPTTSLVTDHVRIYGNGFKPNTPITIKASVKCSTEKLSFKSFAHYFTCKDGKFDLSLCESVGGSYEGIDNMGLFWSMVKTANSINRFQVCDASIPKIYNFSVLEGHVNVEDNLTPCCSTSGERIFLRKDVKRSKIKIDNLRGTLFTPEGKGPLPAIITLYGGNKWGDVIEDTAAILSNYGFITLAIQYFGCEGLPDIYTEEPIKIERFEAVVDYLLSLENCSSVGVYGLSKGAEIGIAMMSFLPNVKAVASVNGYIASVGTSTTYKENTIKQVGMDLERVEMLPDDKLSIINLLNNPEDEPLATHPLEFSSADLLLVVGLDDYNWRSELSADVAQKKMDFVGKTNYEVFKCPGLGHLVDAPYTPPCISGNHPLVPMDVKLYYGGKDKKMHALQQKYLWPKVISFFINSLKKNTY